AGVGEERPHARHRLVVPLRGERAAAPLLVERDEGEARRIAAERLPRDAVATERERDVPDERGVACGGRERPVAVAGLEAAPGELGAQAGALGRGGAGGRPARGA